ncbi:Hypothetical predicted protein [Cloeon dipterum]|uniref:Uncharacterized protein n=1 Tax=Cloeon dipterum TaxID=197152 RepID=A0A8S1DPB7_9INSE|nr:Hypothetical predicted protein [Cloeon dipterum]
MFFVGEAETTLYLQERHRKGLDAESEEEPDAKVGHTRIPCWTQGINSKILCKVGDLLVGARGRPRTSVEGPRRSR